MNANMNPGARIPRNAVRAWQSIQTIDSLPGSELTKSLRLAVLDHLLWTALDAECNAVHPKDWTDRAGHEALRATAEELRRHEIAELSQQFNQIVGLRGTL
jgi:hypothetical protein